MSETKPALVEEWESLSRTAEETGWRVSQSVSWENDKLIMVVTKGQNSFFVHYINQSEPELEKIELIRRFNNITQIDIHMQQN